MLLPENLGVLIGQGAGWWSTTTTKATKGAGLFALGSRTDRRRSQERGSAHSRHGLRQHECDKEPRRSDQPDKALGVFKRFGSSPQPAPRAPHRLRTP